MQSLDSSSIAVPARSSTRTGPVRAGPPGRAAEMRSIRPGPRAVEPFDRVARLAAMVLGTSLASVTVAEQQPASRRSCPSSPGKTGWQTTVEGPLIQAVIESGDRLVIDDARLDLRPSANGLAETAGVRAWAGFPVRDPRGNVVAALWVADHLPRCWSAAEVELLESLAHIAECEVALQVALRNGAEYAELAQTLQESLLPPRLPQVSGLDVAARYVSRRDRSRGSWRLLRRLPVGAGRLGDGCRRRVRQRRRGR